MARYYRVCFVGLGSIAERHILNLRHVLKSRGDNCTVDVLRSGHGRELSKALDPHVDNVYYNPAELFDHYDIVFVTNPTAYHHDTMKLFRCMTDAFFVEKPVFHRSDIGADTSEFDNVICYVACPLRYTGVIQYLKENVNIDDVRNIRVVSASYLPDWRPGTDYRKTYSSSKELGGGVSIDLIHEWDYITYIMGVPHSVKSTIRKISDLEVNSDDIAVYTADYDRCIVELHLDYFSRHTIRRIEITTDEDVICADLVGQTVQKMGNEKIFSFDKDRDTFQRKELDHFLDIVEGKEENTNDLEHAVRVLEIAEGKAGRQ